MSKTQEFTLRAMAENYGLGPHSWDRLDRDACHSAAAEIAGLRAKLETYEEILRAVCGHLELPQSESGPADDVRLYDRALEAADEYAKEADAALAINRDARFKAEAEVERLRLAADYISPYLRWTISTESPGHAPTMPSAVAAFHVAFDIDTDTEAKRVARMRTRPAPTTIGGEHG